MTSLGANLARFPLTWTLLVLVSLDLLCRANPSYGALLPWIDATAVLASLGLLRARPGPAPVPERVSHP